MHLVSGGHLHDRLVGRAAFHRLQFFFNPDRRLIMVTGIWPGTSIRNGNGKFSSFIQVPVLKTQPSAHTSDDLL